MKLHRYVDHQRLHIVTKDVISLSISVLLLFRHYISHKITFGAPSSGGVLRSACGAFISCINICRVPRMLFEHEANRPSVQHHSRDPASVNAMKQTCVIVILAYFTLFQLNSH